MEAVMPKKAKKLVVNLKPITQDIEKAIKTLSGFKSKVSAADSKNIDLRIKLLHHAVRDVKQSCKDAKMTPGFTPSNA
jgi:hypothetical protein